MCVKACVFAREHDGEEPCGNDESDDPFGGNAHDRTAIDVCISGFQCITGSSGECGEDG